jgi:hypothetical protein
VVVLIYIEKINKNNGELSKNTVASEALLFLKSGMDSGLL